MNHYKPEIYIKLSPKVVIFIVVITVMSITALGLLTIHVSFRFTGVLIVFM